MSEKRRVATYRVTLVDAGVTLEGPIVAPDKGRIAENFESLHQILSAEKAVLLYDKQWIYVPQSAILTVHKGGHWFSLPWPLRSDDGNATEVSTD